ncbi:MAG: aminotransferase class I/II-fold pyridoxal phosphate-dependent enzyme [Thermoanaerobaculia bacterium]|nr:aminotransferase class I/II-fold pyridoxal phosphate-dependent enzyme [Thermoanaerobaculia bacterium]
MPMDRLEAALGRDLADLVTQGRAKGAESVITAVVPAAEGRGPRYLLAGHGDRPFLKMNSNNYLGLGLDPEVMAAEEAGTARFGAGPGAVRFISGTYAPHVELEAALAAFHGRAAGMIWSSAYATMIGTLVPLLTAESAVISDELNHNCIINALRLARPKAKIVYKHNDLAGLAAGLEQAAAEGCKRAVVVTDGIFSMRGDHAPLAEVVALVRTASPRFEEDAVLVVDDSHGVGAFGATGRGTEEYTGTLGASDVLIGTLGKAFGVNGGYVVSSARVIEYLRETSPTYIYSNPITPGEAVAAKKALEVLTGPRGQGILDHLRAMTRRFESGLLALGYETIPGEHPVTPLMVRDTPKTNALVAHLREHGILATGLKFPVVPRGDESIRFQISADHTAADIDETLAALASFPGRG